MPKTVLITGGAGYIGSQTNLYLLEKGFQTIILDNLSKGHSHLVPPESILVKGDLLDYDDIQKVFSQYDLDGVIHFAGSSEVFESQTNPQKYYHNNLVASLNLFQAMQEFEVKNLVFSSTAAVYGKVETLPILETDPTNPINTYGRTKLMIEQVMADYARSYGFKGVALRYFNACGADLEGRTGEDHTPESHLIPIIYETLTGQRSELLVYGNDYQTPDGTCIRDYIHTLDLASGHLAALDLCFQKEEGFFEAVNLASGQGHSVLEIVRMVEKITQKKVPTKIAPRRPGDPDSLIADNTKAKKILNWQPKCSDLETIISSSWLWTEKNQKNR